MACRHKRCGRLQATKLVRSPCSWLERSPTIPSSYGAWPRHPPTDGVRIFEIAQQLSSQGFLWVTDDLCGVAAWLPPGFHYDDSIDTTVTKCSPSTEDGPKLKHPFLGLGGCATAFDPPLVRRPRSSGSSSPRLRQRGSVAEQRAGPVGCAHSDGLPSHWKSADGTVVPTSRFCAVPLGRALARRRALRVVHAPASLIQLRHFRSYHRAIPSQPAPSWRRLNSPEPTLASAKNMPVSD